MRWQLFSSPGSSSSGSSTHILAVPAPPTVNRWETIMQDEQGYQERNYASPDELPGCMSLVDEFLMCYALVPQLRSLYRSGQPRDCTWKWRDFKYCMSLKSESVEVRRELWVKRRAEWWAKRRVEGSSEDVWDLRTEPLKDFPPLYPEGIDVDEVVK